jgi:hypothetical protein
MKTTTRLTACALLALGSATLASAVTPGTLANCTLTLTLSETAPGFPDGDYEKETTKGSVTTYEYKEKVVTSRVGVAEVLKEMLESDILDDTTITGWNIVSVSVPWEEGDSTSQLVAVKTGKAPVAVPSDFSVGATASTYTEKNIMDEAKGTEKYSASGTYKQAVRFILLGRELYGVATGSGKWTEGSLKVGSTNYPYGMFVEGAQSLKGIVGVEDDESGDGAVIEGSASLAAAKVADVESFLSVVGWSDGE